MNNNLVQTLLCSLVCFWFDMTLMEFMFHAKLLIAKRETCKKYKFWPQITLIQKVQNYLKSALLCNKSAILFCKSAILSQNCDFMHKSAILFRKSALLSQKVLFYIDWRLKKRLYHIILNSTSIYFNYHIFIIIARWRDKFYARHHIGYNF